MINQFFIDPSTYISGNEMNYSDSFSWGQKHKASEKTIAQFKYADNMQTSRQHFVSLQFTLS